ncbi:MAG: hypothetical protein IH845_04475 [Nanoarchaeota archaeon]|nr:hypothetical protein [Nanoarchaeota archaeon]
MKKLVGYSLSGIGLAVMVVGIGNIKFDLLKGIGETYIIGVGVVIVVAGVVMSMMNQKYSPKSNKSSEEIPIYEGTGKERKIVGYRRD